MRTTMGWTRAALLALVVAVVAAGALRTARSLRERRPQGAPVAAPALALEDLQGRRVDLSALRGKVVAVNFWASWCGPCRQEMPELVRFWREHQGRCFELLGVAEESARSDVERAARGLPYPILLDADAGALGRWEVQGYPTTFVVDAEGRIRRVFRGGVDAGDLGDAVAPLLPAACPGGQG